MSGLAPEQDSLLSKLYHDQKFYVGRDKLYKYIATNHPESGISRRGVLRWLQTQEVYQKTVRPPPRIPTKQFASTVPERFKRILQGRFSW